MPEFDYIVVGCGGIGSAAVYWLSRRAGARVLGLEQYSLGHDNGGSQDHSRIIRLSYHDVKYTQLTRHTYEAFAEVERESGLQLVYKTGGLDLATKGTPGEDIVNEYARAMDDANIKYERLNPRQLKERYPQFAHADELSAIYQSESGLVDAALSNSVHQQLARAHGAKILDNILVTRIETRVGGEAVVHTSKGTFSCKKVIVTAGSWTNHVLGSLGVHVPLRVTQEQVTYFATPHVRKFTKDRFPIFIYHLYDGKWDYYALPIHGNSGFKIGIDASGPLVTPETRTFSPDTLREKKAMELLERYLPESIGPIMYTKTCLYDMPMDRNFIIDTLKSRGKPQVIVCNGAAHAFKFACLLGKILSQMAIDGRTEYPIEGFTIDRPAVNEPTQSDGVTVMGLVDQPGKRNPSKL